MCSLGCANSSWEIFIATAIVYTSLINVNMKYERFHSISQNRICQVIWNIFLNFFNQVFIPYYSHKILISSSIQYFFLWYLAFPLSSFHLQLNRLKHQTWEQRKRVFGGRYKLSMFIEAKDSVLRFCQVRMKSLRLVEAFETIRSLMGH